MSDDQFSQLQTQMTAFDVRMDGFDTRMDKFERRMTSVETTMKNIDRSLARMFSYMERRFDNLEETKADKTDVNRIYDQVDGLIKRFDDEQVERTAIISQLNRHDRWHQQTADHLGLKFD